MFKSCVYSLLKTIYTLFSSRLITIKIKKFMKKNLIKNLDALGTVCGKYAKKAGWVTLGLYIVGLGCKYAADKFDSKKGGEDYGK